MVRLRSALAAEVPGRRFGVPRPARTV